jgi:hypothetical protein
MGSVRSADDDLDGAVSPTRPVRSLLPALAALALIAAACTAGSTASNGTSAANGDTIWRTTPLRDARTGTELSVDGLRGKLVAIEPMAIWCSNCRIQQHEAAAAIDATQSDDLVYLSLDVDPNEQPDALADYTRREGFDWPFAVASREVARSLAESFGDQVLSPPSTPLILVGPDGGIIDVHFGIRGADELTALFAEHLP